MVVNKNNTLCLIVCLGDIFSSLFFSAAHAPYKWDYWPHEDVRAECRFVGLTNLGATCYLASTIQQLYMIPEARQAVFTAKVQFSHVKN